MTAPTKPIAAMTQYVVLQRQIVDSQPSDGWLALGGTVTARDANHAIKLVVEAKVAHEQHATQFIAVPARSWKPIKVTQKVETTLVLEEAKS